jgi:hypothetical protein
MKSRCYSQNRKEYKDYGGRGIKVCERWHSFENFLADMGERPEGTTLDGIDNDGDYTKENCRWATHTVQNRNSRHNRVVTVNGRKMSLAQACEELQLPYVKTLHRLLRGWSEERALELTPS